MILLITHSNDFYTIDLVKDRLSNMGYESIRLNSDYFPSNLLLTEKIGTHCGKSFNLKFDGISLNTNEIQAVWIRKIGLPKISKDVDEIYQDSCFRESNHVLNIFLTELQNKPIIDPFAIINRIDGNKFYQLEMANKAGLDIPLTLITNNADELKEFYKNNHKLVAKLLTPLTTSMEGTSNFVFTSLVTDEHIKNIDTLHVTPMTFQELIEKEYELRVIYIAGNFFTGKIDASQTLKGRIDWRLSKQNEIKWENYDLPQMIKNKITLFMNSINLTFGAIDLIKDKNNRYIFLEVNPTGEWGMLEKDLALPISEAIAKALLNKLNNY